MSFTSRQRVRFGDCDLAGIGYYPRLLALVDAAIEEWIEATLGLGRKELVAGLGLGLPTADLKVGFGRPCQLGETLDMRIVPVRLGWTSITLLLTATANGEARFSATLVQVLLTTANGEPTPWPAEWRARISASMPAPAPGAMMVSDV